LLKLELNQSLQHCSGLRGALLRKALLRGAAEVVGSTPMVASGLFVARGRSCGGAAAAAIGGGKGGGILLVGMESLLREITEFYSSWNRGLDPGMNPDPFQLFYANY